MENNNQQKCMENNNITYKVGGPVGDFIHSMIVCKYQYECTGKKADIYMSNDGVRFNAPIETTYKELLPVLSNQEWFNSLNIFNGEPYSINLAEMRDSPLLWNESWIEIYLKTFCNLNENDIPKDYYWISLPEKLPKFSESLIINRSLKRHGPITPEAIAKYEQLIDSHPASYFVCSQQEQYDHFLFKNKVELVKVKDLYEMYTIINSGKMYMGNLSAPSAIATSLNIPRVVELCGIDKPHYGRDIFYYKNFQPINWP